MAGGTGISAFTAFLRGAHPAGSVRGHAGLWRQDAGVAAVSGHDSKANWPPCRSLEVVFFTGNRMNATFAQRMALTAETAGCALPVASRWTPSSPLCVLRPLSSVLCLLSLRPAGYVEVVGRRPASARRRAGGHPHRRMGMNPD